ncbi:hypothetical protein L1887_39793 [Cichorium endivia]|nr:hypothetical protein L1887_39793 [Cichorium endivia]
MTSEFSSTSLSSSSILAMAANSTFSDSPQFPNIALRLDRTNYSLWRGTIYSALEAYDLVFCLDPTTIPPTTIIDQPATATTPATRKQTQIMLHGFARITWFFCGYGQHLQHPF